MNHPHCFCEPPLSKMHNYFFPELNVTATSGRGLHCTPPLYPSTAPLHCIPLLHPSTAPLLLCPSTVSLHCVPTLHPSTAPLHCVPTLCPSTAPLHCIPPLWSFVITDLVTVVPTENTSAAFLGSSEKHKNLKIESSLVQSLLAPIPQIFHIHFFFNSSTRAWGIT